MTPQLMQAIKLLQLSTSTSPPMWMASWSEIRCWSGRRGRAGPRRGGTRATAPGTDEEPRNGDWIGGAPGDQPQTIEERLDTGLENVFPDEAARRHRAPGTIASRRPIRSGPVSVPAVAPTATTISRPSSPSETTLAGHLAEQVALAFADPVDRMIAQYLVDIVDEAGYLTGDSAEVADKLGAPLAGRGGADAVADASTRRASARAI